MYKLFRVMMYLAVAFAVISAYYVFNGECDKIVPTLKGGIFNNK
jgi:hypothetical protein